ncbi:MAG TPA: universal stress protein, partial [Bacteroidota bacterium]|nr:universal stress protein [Bacteroidota bacterium]
ISIAEKYEAEIHLLHVVDTAGKSNADEEQNARKIMKTFVNEHIDESVWVLQAVRSGRPHDEIVRYAQMNGINLIVIATHGRTGISHAIMGSIAEKVVRHSPVPVLTVHPSTVIERLVSESDVLSDLHIAVRESAR